MLPIAVQPLGENKRSRADDATNFDSHSDVSEPSTFPVHRTMTRTEMVTFSARKATPTPTTTHTFRTPETNNSKHRSKLSPPPTETKNKLEHYKPVNAHKLAMVWVYYDGG